jgi:catalase
MLNTHQSFKSLSSIAKQKQSNDFNCMISILLTIIFLYSCGATVVSTPEVVEKIKPTDEPLAPQPMPQDESEVEALNTEYYLGSKEEEERLFADFMKQIQQVQTKQSEKKEQPIQRGFHAKAHGCFYGKFELLADRDERTKFGVFAKEYESWPIWARFSNGVGWKQADDELDARGLAIKLMGVQGAKNIDAEKETQDFLMTNSASPVGKNAIEFMEFAHKNVNGVLSGVFFALAHPRTAAPALLFNTNAIDSMVNEQFWSGGAFHLGAHQSVKFTTKPCEGTVKRKPQDDDDPDYLQKDLALAGKSGLCYTFYVQLQVNAKDTPIENAAKVWDEDISPLLPVGRLIFPAQDSTKAELKDFCQQLSFNPWHGLFAHRPMGHINRARRFVYESSKQFRKGGIEPKDFLGLSTWENVKAYQWQANPQTDAKAK